MTDNEIIKALECCCEAELNEDCKKLKCPFFDYELDNCTNEGDMDAMYRFALDLINRQKAEIKRLQYQVNRLKEYDEKRDIALHSRLIATSRAEAVKEFAERLKTEKFTARFCGQKYDLIHSWIDNLVKEMVGDTE